MYNRCKRRRGEAPVPEMSGCNRLSRGRKETTETISMDYRYRLRPMLRSDMDTCAALETACYPPAVCEGIEVFKKILSSNPSGCWVAVDDQDHGKRYDTAVVGYCLFLPLQAEDCPLELSALELPRRGKAYTTLYLHDIAVAPAARRRGVANILQSSVADAARFSNFRTITLTAVCGAAAYWQRCGYQMLFDDELSDAQSSRLKNYPADCGAARLMRIDLLRPIAVQFIPNPAPEEYSGEANVEEALMMEEVPAMAPQDEEDVADSSRSAQRSEPEPAVPAPAPAFDARPLALPPRLKLSTRTPLKMRSYWAIPARLMEAPLPAGYRFVRHGQMERASVTVDYETAIIDYADAWAKIITATGELPSIQTARSQYKSEFEPQPKDRLASRVLYLLNDKDDAIGTATGWFEPDAEGAPSEVGRLHWLALVPKAQGMGLGTPLLAAVLRVLVDSGHKEIILKTHTQAARAVAMYLSAGFVPAPMSGGVDIQKFTEAEGKGWKMLANLGLPVTIPGTELT